MHFKHLHPQSRLFWQATFALTVCALAQNVQAQWPPLYPPPVQLRGMRTVAIPAGEFWRYNEQLGFEASVTFDPPHSGDPSQFCRAIEFAQSGGGRLRLEYITGIGSAFIGDSVNLLRPPTITRTPDICQMRLFGAELKNGWELVELRGIDTTYCSKPDQSFELSRRSSNLSNTTHDAVLTAGMLEEGTGSTDLCLVEIDTAVLRGPIGQSYKDAFSN